MLRALHFSHQLLTNLVEKFPEGLYIDATLGKGNDTYFILNQPTFEGEVYGFDIQSAAIEASLTKIENHPKKNKAHLIHDSHEKIASIVKDKAIHGAIFNLGYLPGGDHSITTQYESTIMALKQIQQRLEKNGQIILVVYSGHPQGKIEKEKLFEHLTSWPQEQFQVLQYEFINQRNEPPMLLIIEKIA